ncbi:MAG: tetratricopeptide repeat-containing glycosyltransferase family protein [Planctomycetota bacterium]|nr:tetratricopeptide repeat-containing glycosyltransferase family protein [Planctomycetota bacterium]
MAAPESEFSVSSNTLVDQGLVHQQCGRLVEAELHYDQALAQEPGHVEALHLLGLVRHQTGRYPEAVELIQKAIALKAAPCPVLLTNVGAALQESRRWDEAEESYRQAIQAKRDYLPAHENLCRLLPIRGKALAAAEAWMSLGNQLLDLGKPQEAHIRYRLAFHFKPEDATLLHGLATTLASQGRLEESLAMYRAALSKDPKSALCWTNLGWVLSQLGRLDEAVGNFRKAILLAPEYAEAHMCLAATLLRMGHFSEGWAEYEWRWKSSAKQFVRPARSQPEWRGEPLSGRTLLVESEQGLGDILQFVRYVELLRRNGEHVLFRCPKPLQPLLNICSNLGDCMIHSEDALPYFDCFVPLLSLPRIFATTVETVPANVPYLRVPTNRVEAWCGRIGVHKAFRIGIVWQGSTSYSDDSQRSFHLNKFGPLAYFPGVELICLQKGNGSEQLRQISFPVRTLGEAFDVEGPFLDTAAVMKNLDLVIAPNTSIAHLAGALNVPVWVILSGVASDWRWIALRDDSPWYPSMRLFRPKVGGDWDEVFNRVYSEVARISRS